MSKIYKEYAEALFALGLETGEVDAYSQGLDTVSEAFTQNPEYMDFLACYSIPVGERVDALAEAFADALPHHVLSFLQLICEQGNIKMFADIRDEYARLLFAHRSMKNATVYSVIELTQAQKAALGERLEKLCGQSVSISYEIDKSIMGGLYIDMDGNILDGSIRHRLHEVKEVIDK